jgi:hypothetical protein
VKKATLPSPSSFIFLAAALKRNEGTFFFFLLPRCSATKSPFFFLVAALQRSEVSFFSFLAAL